VPLVEQWKKEYEETYPDADVRVMVINTAYKTETECDLLIVDEAHRAFSPAFIKLFSSIKYKHLICLTATLPNEGKLALMEQVSPVIYAKHLDEIDGTLAPYLVYNLAVKMDHHTAAKYRVFDQMFSSSRIGLARLWSAHYKDKFKSIFDLANYMAKQSDKTPVVELSKKYWAGMSLRKNTLYSCPSKMEAIVKLVKQFPKRK